MKLSILLLFCACSLAVAMPKPVGVSLIDKPNTDTGFDVGKVQIKYDDGHTEIADKSDKCGMPKLSASGDVGWSVWKDKVPGRYVHTGEILRVKLHDGTTKDFQPNALFVQQWAFADKDRAIVISSMQHHGSLFFIKYNLSSGKVLGRVDEYMPKNELPAWARPFSDDD